ncbi:MAG: quinone oxidoreductase family protein [Gaiellaceae bacterium]
MRAALIEKLGEPPLLGEAADPEVRDGDALLEVVSSTINPIDLSIAAGRFFAGAPEVPYVPGREGVGRVLEAPSLAWGTLVYFEVNAGFGRSGSLAERATAPASELLVLPEGADPDLAVCLGIAGIAGWLALDRAQLRAGERVLVLGASGAVGQVALQGARIRGAGRIVAAARSQEGLKLAERLGADATVSLDGDPGIEELAERFREAAGGELEVVIDPLWGLPASAALLALGSEGRLVNLGQSAGATIELPSAVVRGRARAILGHFNGIVPPEKWRQAYLALLEHALHGELEVAREVVPLDRIAEAWSRQAASPNRKLVLCP